MTEITARLDMMNDGLQTTAELQNMIYRSAQRARASYQDTAAFVAKLGTLAGDAFASNEELIAFAEQINKQITLSGASSTEAAGALLQLTQALSSGMLRGEELNSVLEQTPMIAQTIAEYMGVTVGEMRELASEGKITADVVKNAMFAAADDINEKFEQMPMTWSQVWTQFKNSVIQNMQPVLDIISQLANNLDELAPAIWGVVAAAGAWLVITKAQALWTAVNTVGTVAYNVALMAGGAAMAVYGLATGSAAIAQEGLNMVMRASPIGWVLIIVGVLIGLLYKWIKAIGGVQIAWATLKDWLQYGWDMICYAFQAGLNWVSNVLDSLQYGFLVAKVAVLTVLGDMKVSVLLLLQDMVNGAIDIINGFISVLNLLPGVAIEPIEKLTFGSTAYLENEAAKQQNRAAVSAAKQELETNKAQRAEKLAKQWDELQAAHQSRLDEIEAMKQANAATGSSDGGGIDDVPPYEEYDNSLNSIAGDVSSIEKSVNMADEDLQQLIDMAERQYVNRINLTAQTPVITVNGANTGNTQADRQALANTIRDILLEQAASGATRSTARAFSGG